MKIRIVLLSFLWPLVLIAGSQAFAQDTDSGQPPAPAKPYIRALPAEFSLVEKYTYVAPETKLTPQEQAAADFMRPAAGKVNELRVIAQGGIRRESMRYADGHTQEVWRIRSCRLAVNPAQPNSIMASIVATGPYNPNSPNQYRDTADFAELAWVDEASYEGVQTQQGRKCYAFKSGDQTAWIDVTTHLPVYFFSSALLISYVYSQTLDEPLKVPPAIADRFAQLNRVMHGQL
jgi:hypothetical protein